LSVKWVVGIWCVACFAGLLFQSVSQLDEFDPESKLSLAIADIEFEQNLVNQLQKNTAQLPSRSYIFQITIVFAKHWRKPYCAFIEAGL